MRRACIVFPMLDYRSASLIDSLSKVVRQCQETEIVALFYQDKTAAADAAAAFGAHQSVFIQQVDLSGQSELTAMARAVADRKLASFYYFHNGVDPLDVQSLSSHCRGSREIQLFDVLAPASFDARDDEDPATQRRKYGNIEVLSRLDFSNIAVSQAIIVRLFETAPNLENISEAALFECAKSWNANIAASAKANEWIDLRILALRRAYDYFIEREPAVANTIIGFLKSPGFFVKLCEGAKWSVKAKSLVYHFGDIFAEATHAQIDGAFSPFQAGYVDVVGEGSYRGAMAIVDRFTTNRLPATALRKIDFTERERPLTPLPEGQPPAYSAQYLEEINSVDNGVGAGPSVQKERLESGQEPGRVQNLAKRISRRIRRELDKNYTGVDQIEVAPVPAAQRRTIAPKGALDFSLIGAGGFGSHRDGWNFVMQSLLEAVGHHDDAIGFDGFMEKSFVWNFGCVAGGRDKRWIGVTHRPRGIPRFYDWKSRLHFYQSPYYHLCANTNVGLITVSSDHAEYLRRLLNKPVETVLHPTNHNVAKWRPDALQRGSVQLVQIGSWLRKLHSIFLLPSGPYRKAILAKSRDDLFSSARFQGEAKSLKAEIGFQDSAYESADVIEFLDAASYDALLAECVVFLDLYDATANNTVLECIARHTPIIVRKLGATVEYLGEEYPLYFETLDEAAALASDPGKLMEAHQYLQSWSLKPCFYPEAFIEGVKMATRKLAEASS
ncbi:MAG: hypothetical protein R3C60_14175 [Parvularculaceae bacterium]